VLDNITLYWLTRTGASSARLYWESISEVTAWFTRPGGEPITVPTGCTVFPQEVPRPTADGQNLGFQRSSTGENPRAAATSASGNNRSCSSLRCARWQKLSESVAKGPSVFRGIR
jgi:hypothetical protein